jgi:hypothetical protein
MIIFRYDLDHQINIKNFKKDLYINLNMKFDSDELICKYVDDFVIYYNKIHNLLTRLSNDLDELNYSYEFEINYINNFPTLSLRKISLTESDKKSLIKNYKNLTNKIKRTDYVKITDLLDYNYSIKVNNFPYFIVEIYKTIDYVLYDNFHTGNYVLLKNLNSEKKIKINFDNNKILFINPKDKLEKKRFTQNDLEFFENLSFSDDLNDLDDSDDLEYSDNSEDSDSNIEEFSYKLYKNKLIIPDGPIIIIKKTIKPNEILFDNNLYLIESESTIDLFNYMQIE